MPKSWELTENDITVDKKYMDYIEEFKKAEMKTLSRLPPEVGISKEDREEMHYVAQRGPENCSLTVYYLRM